MTKDEADKAVARAQQLRPMIEAANAVGDRETVSQLAGEWFRDVGLPLFLPYKSDE